MGSPENEPRRRNDETQHLVTVSGFYMGKYEVTQKEWREVIGTNGSYFKGDSFPVECVNWYDAVVFCNRLSITEGLGPAYRINGSTDPAAWGTVPTTWRTVPTNLKVAWDAVEIVAGSTGYRLPTEAEWEYACRAGTTTPFSTGKTITTDQANYGNYPDSTAAGEFRETTTPVGNFPPNAWGLYDMHGNVWEWCWDWHGDYPSEVQTNPAGLVSGSNRVFRGGSWRYDTRYLRSASRGFYAPDVYSFFLGFRLVRPLGDDQ
jgi:formylglycine-generating enzyme required for sulfatase activity